jgi:hypothetical protein
MVLLAKTERQKRFYPRASITLHVLHSKMHIRVDIRVMSAHILWGGRQGAVQYICGSVLLNDCLWQYALASRARLLVLQISEAFNLLGHGPLREHRRRLHRARSRERSSRIRDTILQSMWVEHKPGHRIKASYTSPTTILPASVFSSGYSIWCVICILSACTFVSSTASCNDKIKIYKKPRLIAVMKWAMILPNGLPDSFAIGSIVGLRKY